LSAPIGKNRVMAQTRTRRTPLPEPPPEVIPPEPPSRRPRALPIVAGALVVLALLLFVRLGALERGGPPHFGVSMGTGIPGTLYLPGKLEHGQLPLRAAGHRPALIVIAHGYSADQQLMSAMARSFARAGYAALTFDFRGHGSNTAPFKGDLRDDFRAVLDWATASPDIDANRIVVLGHSMGAGAALDFATIDPRPKAVIPVSGGFVVNDARVPPHVLFIAAQRDPGFIRDRQAILAAELQGRTDVESLKVGGTDHVTVLWSKTTITHVIGFLDRTVGSPIDRVSAGRNDPRLGTTVIFLLVALGLVAFLGLVVGRTVQPVTSTATNGAWILLGGAVLLTMPLLATGGYNLLPLGPGQPLAVHLALAGGLLWLARFLVRRGAVTGAIARWIGDGPWLPLRSVVGPGVAAGLVLFVLLTPVGLVFHRLVPDVERALLWVVVAALMLPFFAAFEALIRRGSTRAAIGRGVLGRLLLIAALVVGVGVQILPPVLGLVIPIIVLEYVILEIFAATSYASGRNPALVAVVDSVFIAWFIVMLTPIG
jgi:dienelactone hydrolase